MDSPSGQLMQRRGDFPHGSPEPVDSGDDQVVALPKPAHALCPARPIAAGTPGSCVGEHPIRNDPCSRNSILLLIDGLLSGGDPKIGSDAHQPYNKKSPIFNPVSDTGELGSSCDTGK